MGAPRGHRGFTLIEVFVGLLIFGLLLMLGMPSFTTFMRNSEIRSTAESVINGLRTASAEAMRRNSRIAFIFTGTGASWQIRPINDPTTDVDCTDFGTEVIQEFAAAETRNGARVTATPAESAVCFTGLGRVFNSGTDDHIREIDIQPATTGEGSPLRIIVDDRSPTDPAKPRGLRMCDPRDSLKAVNDPRAC
jgi:type IV fimbrial biogenesis protein FimT